MNGNHALELDVAEYNLSMAHRDLSANLEDVDALMRIIGRIYKTWPETFHQIDQANAVLARLVLRDNRARNFLAQELKRIVTT